MRHNLRHWRVILGMPVGCAKQITQFWPGKGQLAGLDLEWTLGSGSRLPGLRRRIGRISPVRDWLKDKLFTTAKEKAEK